MFLYICKMVDRMNLSCANCSTMHSKDSRDELLLFTTWNYTCAIKLLTY